MDIEPETAEIEQQAEPPTSAAGEGTEVDSADGKGGTKSTPQVKAALVDVVVQVSHEAAVGEVVPICSPRQKWTMG